MEAEGRPETDGEHLSERASAAAGCADWGGGGERGEGSSDYLVQFNVPIEWLLPYLLVHSTRGLKIL